MTETQKQLEEVRAAISAVLSGGQSYRLGPKSVTRADLAALTALKKELETAAAGESGSILGSRVAAAVFDWR